MTVDLAALDELLDSLTEGCAPGPWHGVWGGTREARSWWLDNEAGDSSFPDPDDVATMLNALPALVRVALAAKDGPANNEPDCTCDRDDDSDPGGPLTLCPKHERMLRPLRWETLAMMVIDLMAKGAALRAALADLD